ncbi:hypothetical protein VTH06DRAFT_3199 [Thermothelomyces fergusii]
MRTSPDHEPVLEDTKAKLTTSSPPPLEFIVGWDEPETEDPNNPVNWPPMVKWANILILSTIGFLVPLVSSMMAPAVQLIMQDYGTTSTAFATFSVSVFVLGFASGPLLWAPLSELSGRLPVYHAASLLFLVSTLCCAHAPGPGAFLALRFLSGFAGAAPIANGSGSIADLVPREQEGQIAIVTIISFCILRETYPPVLLERKAARLRRATGDVRYRSKLASGVGSAELFRQSIVRPSRMLLCRPAVTILCAYVAVLYGTLYLLFATYAFVFGSVYAFPPSAAGLHAAAAAAAAATPEDRLPLAVALPGALAFPAGLFLYGWGVEGRAHWAAPLLGTAVTGFGSVIVFVGVQTYLIDAFEGYAASAVGANTVLRGAVGALLPLGGLDLYRALGWGWGNSLLGFLALALAPVPLLFGRLSQRHLITRHPRWVGIPGAYYNYRRDDPGIVVQMWVNDMPENGRKPSAAPGLRPIDGSTRR